MVELPKCECGVQVSLSAHGGRHWCPDCLWAEIERLQDLVRFQRHLRFADGIHGLDLSPLEVASRADEWRTETEKLIREAADPKKQTVLDSRLHTDDCDCERCDERQGRVTYEPTDG